MNRLFGILCLVLLAACAPGSGSGLDPSGRPIGETPDPGDEPTIENIQARIFTPICSGCHVGAAAPEGLRLDAANSFNDLVGVPSRQVGGLLRVNPFNPDISYLVQKIEGTASVGEQMPKFGPPLPAEDIQLIRQWISEGAMPPQTASASAAKVATVNVRPTTIRIAFTSELDASTVHAGTVLLTRSDGVSVDGYTVSVATVNPRTVLVQLPDIAEDDAPYRLSLSTDDSVSILDISGQAVEPYQMEFQ